jgi:exodeoxyribonuclease VII large subunit
LTACAANHYRYEQQRLTALVQTLEAVSPSSIVQRGYAIVRKENGEIVKNALDLSVGEQLGVELAQGHARVQVVRASEP